MGTATARWLRALGRLRFPIQAPDPAFYIDKTRDDPLSSTLLPEPNNRDELSGATSWVP
jgi:hypothetical protein